MAGRGKGGTKADFLAKLSDEEKKLLDEAMTKGSAAAGVPSLPVNPVINPKNTIDPVVGYEVKASPVMTEFPQQVMAAGRVMADAENPYSAVDPSIQAAASEMQKWLHANTPQQPPAITQVKGRQVVIPAECRTTPMHFLQRSPQQAISWWKFFTGPYQDVMSDWAARRGLRNEPPVAVAQALCSLIDGHNFSIKKENVEYAWSDDLGEVEAGFRSLFSNHSFELVQKVARFADCHLVEALRHCMVALLQQERDTLQQVQTVQTGASWKA